MPNKPQVHLCTDNMELRDFLFDTEDFSWTHGQVEALGIFFARFTEQYNKGFSDGYNSGLLDGMDK